MMTKNSKKHPADTPAENTSPIYKLSIESPKATTFYAREIIIRGWIVPVAGKKVEGVRVKNNDQYFDIEYGLERTDVAKALADIEADRSLKSGFRSEITFTDGDLSIEANLGDGYIEIYKTSLKYSSERLFEAYYNPNLAKNMAEHQVLLDNKKKYYYEAAQPGSFVRDETDPRLIAFYLPQYHPIEQNDVTWGKGFTEWTNVTAGQPRFVGHQQPILPADLGFYDLRLEENLKSQIDLAKKHGVYAFCFYYYWFSGEQILSTPLNSFMNHKEWDFNFMICWANENWTMRWDGRDKDVIIGQKYLKEDPLRFIKDVEHILLDPRYIRSNGKPLLAVYRGSELDNPQRYLDVWREYFKENHGLELEIITMLNFDTIDPRPFGFDGAVEFEPLTTYKRRDFNKDVSRKIPLAERLIDANFTGRTVDYRDIMPTEADFNHFDFPTYKSLAPTWDNDARKKGKGFVLSAANPDLYGVWLDSLLTHAKKDGTGTVFVNAWNEWAEGTMLEPTQHAGHAVLNRTSQVLAKHSANKENLRSFPMFTMKRSPKAKLAVVVHAFYEEQFGYINSKLEALEGIPYDLYVTTQQDLVETIQAISPKANVLAVPNRGRDILPFIFLLQRLDELGYTNILKLHTKRSLHRSDGKSWLEDIVTKLLPGNKTVQAIVQKLDDGAAQIGPKGHFVSLNEYIGSNKAAMVKQLAAEEIIVSPEELHDKKLGYFAGSMFWARIDAFRPLLNRRLTVEDFESEKGQIDGTFAHAVERMFGVVPMLEGKKMYKVSKLGVFPVRNHEIVTSYRYARKEKDTK